MKICAAQTRSVKGDIERNIYNHKTLIELALSHEANVIIFPELSLTGYEPTLAKELATNQGDRRFDDLQNISNTRHVTIGVGVPTKHTAGICISTVLFQPHQARLTYSKKYLHPAEEEFFIRGQRFTGLIGSKSNIALAICYELSVPEHAENAHKSGAEIYIATAAKSATGVTQACKRLSDIANKYAIAVLLSNSVGPSDDFESAGDTSVWNRKGELIAQLDDTHEGVLIYDTETEKAKCTHL